MTGNKWRLAAKSTCTTMASSFTGGIVAIGMSYYQSGGKVEVLATINGVLGALVGVTGKSRCNFLHLRLLSSIRTGLNAFSNFIASCAVITIWEALIIGAIGSFLANITDPLLVYLKVDDAVGATCVHGFGGAWGMIAVGLFAAKDELENYCQYNGLFHGGGGYLLGVQLLATVSFIAWAMLSTFVLLFVNLLSL